MRRNVNRHKALILHKAAVKEGCMRWMRVLEEIDRRYKMKKAAFKMSPFRWQKMVRSRIFASSKIGRAARWWLLRKRLRQMLRTHERNWALRVWIRKRPCVKIGFLIGRFL